MLSGNDSAMLLVSCERLCKQRRWLCVNLGSGILSVKICVGTTLQFLGNHMSLFARFISQGYPCFLATSFEYLFIHDMQYLYKFSPNLVFSSNFPATGRRQLKLLGAICRRSAFRSSLSYSRHRWLPRTWGAGSKRWMGTVVCLRRQRSIGGRGSSFRWTAAGLTRLM